MARALVVLLVGVEKATRNSLGARDGRSIGAADDDGCVRDGQESILIGVRWLVGIILFFRYVRLELARREGPVASILPSCRHLLVLEDLV